MRALLVSAVFALISATASAAERNEPCKISNEGLNLYEQRILIHADELEKPGTARKIAEPLSCLLEIHQKAEGQTKLFAQNFLRPLLGGHEVGGEMPHDPRYQKVARYLEKQALLSRDPLNKSLVSEYTRGDWGFYELFCERGDTSFCAEFLPSGKPETGASPLLAAASIMRLRKAYQVLKGKQREQVAERIKSLHREIPQSETIQRKYIDQIYDELFPTSLPLGMA